MNAAAPAAPVTPVSTSTVPSDTGASSGDGDLMTDDEFERLLDELHGSGKGPTDEELEMATRPVVYRVAFQAVTKAGQYAYRDRRQRKRQFRQLGLLVLMQQLVKMVYLIAVS